MPGALLGAGCWLGMTVCLAARWYRATRSTRLLVRVTSSFRRHSRHLHSSQVGRGVVGFSVLSLYIAVQPGERGGQGGEGEPGGAGVPLQAGQPPLPAGLSPRPLTQYLTPTQYIFQLYKTAVKPISLIRCRWFT